MGDKVNLQDAGGRVDSTSACESSYRFAVEIYEADNWIGSAEPAAAGSSSDNARALGAVRYIEEFRGHLKERIEKNNGVLGFELKTQFRLMEEHQAVINEVSRNSADNV